MRNIALHLAKLLPLLLASLPYAPAHAAPEGSPATIEGIHVRRVGDVPYAREAAETAVRQFEAQCADLSRICTTLLEDQVEALALGVTLPLELFLAPAGEPVQDARTLARSSGSRNATQRWCAREQARTGVNPCEEDARDDED